jgi:hypothetical protein
MTRIGKNACRIGVRDLEKGVRHLVRDGDEISLMPTKEPMYTLHIQEYAIASVLRAAPGNAVTAYAVVGRGKPAPTKKHITDFFKAIASDAPPKPQPLQSPPRLEHSSKSEAKEPSSPRDEHPSPKHEPSSSEQQAPQHEPPGSEQQPPQHEPSGSEQHPPADMRASEEDCAEALREEGM